MMYLKLVWLYVKYVNKSMEKKQPPSCRGNYRAIVQWVLTDFVLVGLLCQVAASNLSFVFGGGEGLRRIFAVVVTVLATAAAYLCAPTSFVLQTMAEHLIPRLHFVFLFILLPLVFIIGKLRGKI